MLRKEEISPIYWKEKQIGTIRRAHIENMQENIAPGQSPLDIASRIGGAQTLREYVYIRINGNVEWKDVFKFLKIKIFKLFNIKSSLDKLFIKKKKEIIDDWYQEILNNYHNGNK